MKTANPALLAMMVALVPSPLVSQGRHDAHERPALSAGQVQRLDAYAGAYRTEDGGVQAITRFDHGAAPIFLFTDFALGWRGLLWPRTDGSYSVVEHGDRPGPQSARLSLAGSEERTSILHVGERNPRRATRIDVRESPSTFLSGETRLAGSLFLPPGDPPHPAVVFVHGSGPATRDDYREWSYFFAAHGIAAFAYDKRGAGESEGDWREARFDDLAGDVIAAVGFLAGGGRIDERRIGLCGGSQGAWVAPLAAAREPRIAWMILVGGGAITPARQERYRRLRLVTEGGYGEQVLELAGGLLDLYFEYLRTEDQAVAQSLSRAHETLSGKPWFDALGIPGTDPTKGSWPGWMKRFQRELFFDPGPSLAAAEIPILVVMGAEDQGFPTAETIGEYHRVVPTDRLTVEIVPGADHGLFVAGEGNQTRHQAPRAFEIMLSWIRRHDRRRSSGADE